MIRPDGVSGAKFIKSVKIRRKANFFTIFILRERKYSPGNGNQN